MSDEAQGNFTEFTLRLGVGGPDAEGAAVVVRVPTARIRPVDFLPSIHPLADALVEAAVHAVRREGKAISCRAGCGACCRQLVPISLVEAQFLAELVAGWPEERRGRVMRRFQEAVASLRAAGLLERVGAAQQGQGASDHEKTELARDYFRAQVACPFLEAESCSIHPDRPLSCREYLVTSPAARCETPGLGVIEKVPLYVKPTQVLFRFHDGEGRGEVRWVPLVLAMQWAAGRGQDDDPRRPGDAMFQDFVQRLAEQSSPA